MDFNPPYLSSAHVVLLIKPSLTSVVKGHVHTDVYSKLMNWKNLSKIWMSIMSRDFPTFFPNGIE